MRTEDEDTWEAEYWDDFLDEFGPEGYIEVRYGVREEVPEWTREAGTQAEQADRNAA